jgi:hypothetical protein
MPAYYVLLKEKKNKTSNKQRKPVHWTASEAFNFSHRGCVQAFMYTVLLLLQDNIFEGICREIFEIFEGLFQNNTECWYPKIDLLIKY